MTKTHRRLTKLEIQLLAQKLPVADLIADDNGYAAASAVTGDDLHPEDFARVVEEAFLIAEYRLEKLGAARDQARTPDVLLQRIVDKRRTDGT